MSGPVIGIARNGSPTAVDGETRIHSAFNPQLEATRFVARRLEGCPERGIIIVIGAGLGYIDSEIRKRHPSGSVVAIHLDDVLYKARIDRDRPPDGKVVRWHPGSGVDLEQFLFDAIDETAVGGLRIVEWTPGVHNHPESAERARSVLARIIRRHTGNISATRAFGRLWIENCMRNYSWIDRILIPGACADPVVLAASGPSLEETVPILRRHRRSYRLWALPSSLAALRSAGLVPDLVVASDPGFWAGLHGRFVPAGTPVAMPFTASTLFRGDAPVLVLDQGSPAEEILGRNANWPRVRIPSTGTVAATAFELWRTICDGPLILAGLDLCWTDLRSHARPHPFDGWIASLENRCRPLQTIAWERAVMSAPNRIGRFRSGPSLRTYADWFSGLNRNTDVVYRLVISPAAGCVTIPGIVETGNEVFLNLNTVGASKAWGTVVPPPLDEASRKQVIREQIRDWLGHMKVPADQPDGRIRNLMYSLDPGGVLDSMRTAGTDRKRADEEHLNRVQELLRRLERRYGL